MKYSVNIKISNRILYLFVLFVVVFLFGMIVYAEISHEASDVIVKLPDSTEIPVQSMSGGDISCALSSKFVGATANSYNGNMNGYSGADSNCADEFPGSHMCSVEEIIRSVRCGTNINSVGWYKSAMGSQWEIAPWPGEHHYILDCQSFESAYDGWEWEDFGLVWNNGPEETSCGSSQKILCCK